MTRLPVDEVLPQLCAALQQDGSAVLSAPPGSGKSTRVPQALLDANPGAGAVVVLQPRRMAARALARFLSEQRGEPVGGHIGYQVRHDNRSGRDTRIRFVTEGILLRQLLDDPTLPGVGTVVLDEFHERHLEGDLALAMLREVRETLREDLRLLVMSATLDAQPLLDYLQPCQQIQASGRVYPVDVQNLPQTKPLNLSRLDRRELERRVGLAVATAMRETDRSVLVFLPGVREIEDCLQALRRDLGSADVQLLPLHGSLDANEQDRVMRQDGRRKVVLSTNIAESSLTLPDVTAVVDSGLVRKLRHDPARGLDRLQLERISQASAEQRAGRAGRVAAGRCYRLWSAQEQRSMPLQDTAEVRRLDLAGTILQVCAFAGRTWSKFAWFEAPEAGALQRAATLLQQLGAMHEAGLSKVGQAMLRYPLHPRLARLMVEAGRQGCAPSAATLCAVLSERDVQDVDQSSDAEELVGLIEELAESRFDAGRCRSHGVHVGGVRNLWRVRQQLLRSVGGGREATGSPGALACAALAAFPDRVARRVAGPLDRDVLMSSGRGARLDMRDHEAFGELCLVLQVRDSSSGPRASITRAMRLQEDWLLEVAPDLIRSSREVELRGERVVQHDRTWFGELLLEERAVPQPDPELAAGLLAERLAADPFRVLGDQKELRAFLARLRWLRDAGADVPEVGDAEVVAAAKSLCHGCTRLSQLKDAPVLPILRASLPANLGGQLEREAPEMLKLPSGRRVRVDYGDPAGPKVAARLQEFFGSPQTPTLAGGRVSVVLHLLAPNHRPVQITRDLTSFWQQVYPKIRGELSRRYPKHSWPEDPLTAEPEQRPRRRSR